MTPAPTTRRRALGYALLLLVTLYQPACAAHSSHTATQISAIDRLLTLVIERLAVAPDVAQTKWNTKAPIEDLTRENQIVATVGANATSAGVQREVAEQFFRAQIEASKVVQRELFAQYETAHQPPFASVADLNTTVRPILDRLTPEMLTALGSALPALQQRGGRSHLQTQIRQRTLPAHVSRRAFDVALAPLVAESR
ncbi:MAG: gamma subclass chorismate mutase AroQ [Vicinamibacterales bacterium]